MTAREVMGLFDMEVLKMVADIFFLICSFTNICLIFYHWKTTNWSLRVFRILMICFIVVLFYEAIFKSPADDALKAIAFGFVPITMLFGYSVVSEKI